MIILLRSRLPLALGLSLAMLLVSACSVHDSERVLSTSKIGQTLPKSQALPIQGLAAADPTDDLWERTRQGFGFTTALEHERITPYFEHYRDHPRIIQLSTERAVPFAYFILSELEARDMPTELLLLPIVESGFTADATSRSRAAGIWQFIPSTGDHFDLKRDAWYDGRRDIHQSTLAALDYLEALYARFDDWYLALAAYNSGQGNVARAIRHNEARGKPTDYWNLQLSAEATAYVPRLLALRKLFLDPEEHTVVLTPIANEPALEIIEPGRQADFELIAEMIDLDAGTLKRLNPGYQRHATHPTGAQHLFVPREAAARLEEALHQNGDNPLIRFREYTVQPGDNLGRIAERAGTRVAVLREMNSINGNLIHAGQTLRLPITGLDPTESATQTAIAPDSLESYEIQPGDSLWSISERTGMSIHALRSANGLEHDAILRPGHTLRVASGPGVHETTDSTIADRQEADRQELAYQVQPGDSLSSIARHFGVAVHDLRRWNALNGDGIHAGETLTLYLARLDEDTLARARDS